MNPQPVLPNRRLLVVDDNQAIHEDIRKVFRPVPGGESELARLETELFGVKSAPLEEPFEIDSAFQGEEALAMVQRSNRDGCPYALAFVDMRMPPGWDGLETISRIWAIDPDLQVVICTAFSDCSWTEMVHKLGRHSGLLILKKPFDTIEVMQLAHTLSAKWTLRREVQRRMQELEGTVAERTEELEHANVRLRRELEEKQQMEVDLRTAERLATVGTLAAGVAHEINNPLAFVISNLQFIERTTVELRGACPEHAALDALDTALEDALSGARRMAAIVRDMRVLSRKDDSQVNQVEVESVIDAALNVAGHELSQRAQLVKRFAGVPRVRANEGRLGQVFLNLIVNAIHAIEPGHPRDNEITVETSVGADGRVVIEVADTGCGIPADVLPQIFDPFFTTKSPGLGTGLGLAICRSIVTAAGGTIEVSSTGGRGTRFSVKLFAASEQRGTASGPVAVALA
ncbi:MAG TPA: ATP-binding protein [Myxococcales bacterium]|nr:ATP-binding protein [Myxococcales bacterium]